MERTRGKTQTGGYQRGRLSFVSAQMRCHHEFYPFRRLPELGANVYTHMCIRCSKWRECLLSPLHQISAHKCFHKETGSNWKIEHSTRKLNFLKILTSQIWAHIEAREKSCGYLEGTSSTETPGGTNTGSSNGCTRFETATNPARPTA